MSQVQIQQLLDFFQASPGMAAGPVNAVTFRAFLKAIVGLENIIRHPIIQIRTRYQSLAGATIWSTCQAFFLLQNAVS
jgi:hypothetical protein